MPNAQPTRTQTILKTGDLLFNKYFSDMYRVVGSGNTEMDKLLGFPAVSPLVFAQTVGGKAVILLGGQERPRRLIIAPWERGKE